MHKPAVLVGAVLFAALSAGAASAVEPLQAAGEAPPSCRGLTATIVGSPGETVEGTPQADVIVTNGADQVEAGAGDDVVCTTNTPPERNYNYSIKVLAGPGDDVIDRSGDPDPAASALTFPEEGEDTVIGGPGKDGLNSTDGDADVIATGAGDDNILAGSVGRPGPTGADSIDLGDGKDLFFLEPSGDNIAPGLTMTGGAGEDTLRISAEGAGRWVLDAASGRATHGGVDSFGFAEIESYSLYTQDERTSGFRFVGTSDGERVGIAPAQAADGADLGAGDDTLSITGPTSGSRAPTARHPFDGGPGTDRVEVWGVGDAVRLSLAGDRLDFRLDNAGDPDYAVLGYEDAQVVAVRARVSGDAAPNTLTWNACDAAVRGGGGDDTVTWYRTENLRCARTGHRVYGNADDDVLGGGPYADVLIGGPGDDVAEGRAGRDTCRAEAIRGCEKGGARGGGQE